MIKYEINRLAKHGLIYGLGGMLNRFISFLLLPLFTTYLTPTDYGISSILGLITAVAAPVFQLGLSAAIAPYYFDSRAQQWKETTIWTAFTLCLVSGSIVSAISISFSSDISWIAFQDKNYEYLVILTIISTFVGSINYPFTQYLQFEERSSLFVILTLITTLISIIVTILLVVFMRMGVKGLITSLLIGQVISTLLFLVVGIMNLRFRYQHELAKKLLRMGIPLIPSFAFFFILQDANRYLLQWIKGLDEVGIYAIGFNMGMIVRLFTGAFEKAWGPFFMSFVDRREDACILFGRITTYYIFGFGSLSLMAYAVAKPVVLLMTQPPFHDAYKVVGFSASSAFFSGIYIVLLPAMYFAKEVQAQSGIQAVAGLLMIGLNLWLIQWYGFWGAGLALMLGMLFLSVLTHLWNVIRKRIYLQVQYEWGRLMKFSLIYLLIIISLTWERHLTLEAEVLISVFFIIVLLLTLYMLMNQQERNIAIGTLKKMRIYKAVELQ